MNRYFFIVLICSFGLIAEEASQIQALEDLLDSYSRSTTVLNLSDRPIDQFSKLCQKYLTSVFIAKNGTKEPNSLLFSKHLSPEEINKLSHHEHFDITVFLGSCPYKQKMIRALLKLSDHVLIEMPEELQNLMSDFLFKLDAQILSRRDDHFLILLSRRLPKYFFANWIGAERNGMPIMTSRHYALIKTPKEAMQLMPGISLYGFKLIEGNYPDQQLITKSICQYPWKSMCACLPWNIMLQGAKIRWQQRFGEPKAWSKEGLNRCLEGLEIDTVHDYKAHALRQLNTIGIEE